MKKFLVLGSISGFLGIALGAFGAHALKSSLAPESMTIFETALRYQMYHTFALIVAGWGMKQFPARPFIAAGWCFVGGIVLFCGSLYVLAISGVRALGVVTPFGGLAFLGGWSSLAWGFWKARNGE